MSNNTRATGARSAAHPTRRNTITPIKRHCVITRIDELALTIISEVAQKWRISRGDAIGRIVRQFSAQGKGFAA